MEFVSAQKDFILTKMEIAKNVILNVILVDTVQVIVLPVLKTDQTHQNVDVSQDIMKILTKFANNVLGDVLLVKLQVITVFLVFIIEYLQNVIAQKIHIMKTQKSFVLNAPGHA